jgi:hypothetical protein
MLSSVIPTHRTNRCSVVLYASSWEEVSKEFQKNFFTPRNRKPQQETFAPKDSISRLQFNRHA